MKQQVVKDSSGPPAVPAGVRRVSPAARVAAAVAVLLLAVHMLFTAVLNVPSEDLKYGSLPGAAADRYAAPYLIQDYKIFAPDPAAADHQLWVRAWIQRSDGGYARSEWVNTSAVELASVTRKTLRKQLSIVGAERLMSAYQGLSPAQQDVAQRNHLDGTELYPLSEALSAADDTRPDAVRAFITADNYVTSYATQVAYALWGEAGEVIGVQSRAVYAPVIRWNDRHDPEAQAPPSSYTDLGWVPAMEWPGQDRDAFARTFTGWARHAGVDTALHAVASTGDGR